MTTLGLQELTEARDAPISLYAAAAAFSDATEFFPAAVSTAAHTERFRGHRWGTPEVSRILKKDQFAEILGTCNHQRSGLHEVLLRRLSLKNSGPLYLTHLFLLRNSFNCFLQARHLEPAWNLLADFIRFGKLALLECAYQPCVPNWLLPLPICRNWRQMRNLRLEVCRYPAPQSLFRSFGVTVQLGSIWVIQA